MAILCSNRIIIKIFWQFLLCLNNFTYIRFKYKIIIMIEEVKLLLKDNAIPFELSKSGSITFYLNGKYCYKPNSNKLLKWGKTVHSNDLLDDGLEHLKLILNNQPTDEEITEQELFKSIDNLDDKLNWGKYINNTMEYVNKTDIQYLKFLLKLVLNKDDDKYSKYIGSMNEHQLSKTNRLVTQYFKFLDDLN